MVSVLTSINFFILFDKFRTSESVTTLLSLTKTNIFQTLLVAGGYNGSGYLSSTELLVGEASAWVKTGVLALVFVGPTSTAES